ncbi:MAG: TIGR00730 family Rossman fold protein [Candidatus Symbiothrix sp.]|nr:TIGR00730 family Rossman fold protein [Candidatus Symbiothrix sp.]
MKQKIKTITVYASSSSRIAPVYFDAAHELGTLLAQYDITCINGGGNNGLMAAVTDAVLSGGGKVSGIIPRFMVNKGWLHPSLTETVVTPGMHRRKQLMAKKPDACIALPGGVGTLDELMEIIAWKQLGLYPHPIVILNTNDYYGDLLTLLERAQKENFLEATPSPLWSVASTAKEALDILLNGPQEDNLRALPQ